MPSFPTRRSVIAGGAALVPLVIAGCSSTSKTAGTAGKEPSAKATPSATPKPSPATVTVSAQHPLTAVQPADTLTFAVANGTLTSVAVTNADGESVDGALSGNDPKKVWAPKVPFRLGGTYTVVATINGQTGSSKSTSKVTVMNGDSNTTNLLYEDMDVGVGMPVIIKFENEVVDAAKRKAIQSAMTITTTPQQEGAWGWTDNTQLMWRPKDYWKAGTKVTVTGKVAGLPTSSHRFIQDNISGSLTIGDSRILYVDISNYKMRVTKNGSTVKTIPITTGKANFATRSGTKVIIERDSALTMDSATVGIPKGDPDYYKLDVKWAMRVTYTGEFIHAAPWSEGQQGSANVSHGCVGTSMADGQWLFNFCRAGDVVVNTGSSRTFKPYEGIGCWCYDWAGWQKLSAV
ncbi:L,D-transpeptidase [Corynebacterium variabile]|uniref:L,D-transpeptidase n=1 Tax=Corynebacterium variabile TaxID=1727 RepID=UPI0026491C17|nr:Ig-like domain-containing protein [Corynebacterium variabile]MDN6476552.1 Ig-like domain-containing protein [Corynebacterium variabile]